MLFIYHVINRVTGEGASLNYDTPQTEDQLLDDANELVGFSSYATLRWGQFHNKDDGFDALRDELDTWTWFEYDGPSGVDLQRKVFKALGLTE